MLHQLPGAFALTTGHAQLQLPDITNKGGDALRDRQRTAGFVQHIVHRQGEGVVVRQAALLSDFCAVSSSGYQNITAKRKAGLTRISL